MKRMRLHGLPFIVFGIVFLLIMSIVTYALWNWLMPAIFHLPVISLWQALGLLLLGRLLFGRFGGWGSRMRKARFVRGWKNLTPEERERFRNAMGPCGPARFREGDAPQKG